MPISKLLIVVPCFNEKEVLDSTVNTLLQYLEEMQREGYVSGDSQICLIDDGSRDTTWDQIESFSNSHKSIQGIKLSRNFGHQAALLAGLMENQGAFDCYISIDADLQDDITVMREMVLKYQDGNSVVYGVRNDRSSDSWFKRTTAEGFYKVMLKMGVPVVFNHADYRLIDDKVLKEFSNYKEVNLFIRGIIPTIGFKSDKVFYSRKERQAGESKYPLNKMLIFAWNGITSFSTVPMKMVLYFGVLNFLVALFIGAYVLISKLSGFTVQGWTSIVLPMAFFSGSNMIAIGLIGEYIGKLYEEVKGRPRYIVEKHN